MSDHLPDDLIIKILERLPVKSLIRCSSVCKSWYSVIRSPSFITQHLYRRVNNSADQIVENEKIVFRACVDDGKKMVGFHSLSSDNSCYNHLKLDVSDGSGLRNVEIVGTCSGLVCLQLMLTKKKDCEVDRVVIWNPSIRKSVFILCTQSSLRRRMFYGFFVHPTTNEYKVLALHCRADNGVPYHAEIYRQGTGAWCAINCVVPHLLDHFFYSQASVNGVVYWLQAEWRRFRPHFLNSIALFNMHTEAFSKTTTLPPSAVHEEPGHLRLLFSRESLVLYEIELQRGDISGYSIWVMRDHGISESWCKLFNVKTPMAWLTPLGLRMNGELLLTTTAGKSLLCHDPVTNRTTTIAIQGVQLQSRCSIADTYVESLLLWNANAGSEHDSFAEFLSE